MRITSFLLCFYSRHVTVDIKYMYYVVPLRIWNETAIGDLGYDSLVL